MKFLYFFSLFVFFCHLFSSNVFKNKWEICFPPELQLKIFDNLDLINLLNSRQASTLTYRLSNLILEKRYLENRQIPHLFWEIFVKPETKNKAPHFIRTFCLNNFNKIVPEIASFYSFSDIKHIPPYPKKNDFRMVYSSKNCFSFVVARNKKVIDNYYYTKINNDDDFNNIFDKKKDDDFFYILYFNYNLDSDGFAKLKTFMQRYKTLLVQFTELIYPPDILRNQPILTWISKNTTIIVPKRELLMYAINDITPYFPEFVKKNTILENTMNIFYRHDDNQKITMNQLLHNLYTTNSSFKAFKLSRFFLLTTITFEAIVKYIREFIDSTSECPLMLFQLEQLFLSYHYPTQIFKQVLNDLMRYTNYSHVFFKVLKKNIIKSGKNQLILDLYFFSRDHTLLKYIYDEEMLYKIIEQCLIKNYKHFKLDIFESGIYLRLYNVFLQHKQYKKKHNKRYKSFKKDVFSSFPHNTEFNDEVAFHTFMLEKKSIKKKIVGQIFNNILLRKKYPPAKLKMYKKLFKQYYQKIKK